MAYSYNRNSKRNSKPLVVLGILFAVMLVGAFVFLKPKDNERSQVASTQPPAEQKNETIEEPEPEQPTFDSQELQKVLDDWASAHAGTYGVVLATKDDEVVASINPDEQFFTASIYKLFVAYEAYMRVDSGEYSLDKVYASGVPLKTCLDEMIRLSVSAVAQNCSETLWSKQGKEEATKKLAEKFGLKNTSLVGLYTSAGDTAIILSRLESAKDLSQSSQGLFLESMKNQIHRKGLPAGITTATVYEKVGFNEDLEYHDAAILRFPDGRSLIVSLFTKSAGTKNVSGLASAIEKSVLETQ